MSPIERRPRAQRRIAHAGFRSAEELRNRHPYRVSHKHLEETPLRGAIFREDLAALAHFQELIPSTDIVTSETARWVELRMVFTHPMEGGPAMNMGQPVRFGVDTPSGLEDLIDLLEPILVDGRRAYSAVYHVQEPGDYIFFIEPAPYWEATEGKMIIHYSKVVVDAYGAGDDWDRAIGQAVEIEPLSRPYGLWTGNLFRGIVNYEGDPVPYAEVEVEWRNDGSVTAPSDPYITQIVKADAQGVFSYAMPRAGWWGFAALLDGPEQLPNPDGEMVPVELGGLIWVHTRDMQ